MKAKADAEAAQQEKAKSEAAQKAEANAALNVQTDAAQTAKEAANSSEKRFDPWKQRLVTYRQFRTELEDKYPLTRKQLQKRWHELGRLQ